jgi:hypothetical protein
MSGKIVISLEDNGEMVPILDRYIDPNVALHLITLNKWFIDEANPEAMGFVLGMVSMIRDPQGTREEFTKLPPELKEAIKKQILALLEVA